jgi:uncharacterized membrane protein
MITNRQKKDLEKIGYRVKRCINVDRELTLMIDKIIEMTVNVLIILACIAAVIGILQIIFSGFHIGVCR